MRWFRPFLVVAIAAGTIVLGPGGDSGATPGASGTPPIFSVRSAGTFIPLGTDDITPVGAFPITCTSADALAPPGAAGAPCAPRVPPSFGLLPFSTTSPVDLGLNGALPGPPFGYAPFTDDLDGLSYGEYLGVVAVPDFDFSVDAAAPEGVPPPALRGTMGLAGCPAPNVNTEVTAVGGPEAQGDIFTTAGAVVGCNLQAASCFGPCDEAVFGLTAPTPAGAPPLDDMDALAEQRLGGPCTTLTGFGPPTVCPVFSLSAASATLIAPAPVIAAAPGVCGGGAANGASILVPPGTPPIPPCLPVGCLVAAGVPCIAVPSADLSLGVAGNDIDGLCWWDANGNMLPDRPNAIVPGMGDYYLFSLTPGSALVTGAPFLSAADLLYVQAPSIYIIRSAASMGLLFGDNVDAVLCHDNDTDGDGAPGLLDNCPVTSNSTQTDGDSDRVGTACDNCPATSNTGQANADGDQWGDACDNCSMTATLWMVPPGDTDCDAWVDGDETSLGTNDLVWCSATGAITEPGDPTKVNDEPVDNWPADMDDDQTVNLSDVLYLAPPKFFSVFPGPPYEVRYDLDLDNAINLSDILYLAPPVFFSTCTP